MEKQQKSSVSNLRIFGYALGEGAMSITMNGIANFAMVYYTLVLGLGAGMVGLALSITTLWDAVTDPVMGHVTDNTRSRFGRRHPYLLVGGVALALSFYLLWFLPAKFEEPMAIFWCILLTNLLVRTAVTVLVVPYTALGFEICPEYNDRARLQGIRSFLNQVVNILFGALAWPVFFKDGVAVDGSRVDGTTIPENYVSMNYVLTSAAFILIILCLFFTRMYAQDNRDTEMEGNSVKAFGKDMGSILKDRLAWNVFIFFGIAQLGMLLVSQIQMFTYVLFMQFSDVEKGFVHGGGMFAFAIGALALSRLVKRFDKKKTGYIGSWISMVGGLSLFAVFSSGLVAPKAEWMVAGLTIPLGTVLFMVFQGMWWGGAGILVPLVTSMIADISEINFRRTGVLKDGSYAAVFSFFMKAAMSLGLLITGLLVDWAGIVPGAEEQAPEAVRNIAAMTFLCGPAVLIFSIGILRKYPVDRKFMEMTVREPV